MHDVAKQQTTATRYNGWSNRETWLANLWLTSDECSYSVLSRATRIEGEAFDKASWLEERLRLQLDQEVDEACLWQDLLRCAFDRISWVEVIEKNLG